VGKGGNAPPFVPKFTPPPYAIPSEGRGFPRLPLRYSRMAAAVRQACRKKHLTNKLMNMRTA